MRTDNNRVLRFVLWALILAFGVSAEAQQRGKVYRIGYISNAPGIREGTEEIFVQALQELGYKDGIDTVIEWRFSQGKVDRLPSLAKELVRAKVDCIVTLGIAPTRAAKQATADIPIVIGNADDDPVRQGLVHSLARPGGNVTGIISIASDLAGKRLEILKETIPLLSQVAVLWDPSGPGGAGHIHESEAIAPALKLEIQRAEIRGPKDLDKAFQAMVKARIQGLVVVTTASINSHRAKIVSLAANTRLPAIYTNPSFVRAGGLMSYADDRAARMHRVAEFVDKIFKGAKPADLPVERPIKFELIINLKAAKQIGLTIPPNVLVRATEVIR
ncbi:MAG: ABC transporter substrate-binding protein [Candidatus Binatia bacterium]